MRFVLLNHGRQRRQMPHRPDAPEAAGQKQTRGRLAAILPELMCACLTLLLLSGCCRDCGDRANQPSQAQIPAPALPAAVLTKASAVQVVTADAPTPTARFAAAEFARCVAAIVGCEAAVRPESEHSENDSAYTVYVGPSAPTAHLPLAELPPEHFFIRTGPNCLYLLGRDDDQDPLAIRFRAKTGTLYAVYTFLNRYAGARWLWPGELGEVLPPMARLEIPPLDLRDGPETSIRLTHYGFAHYHTGADRTAQMLWGRRNGMGTARWGHEGHSGSLVVGTRYFNDHPEYYALVKGERRNLTKYGKLCHAHPEVPSLYANWAAETTEWDVVPCTANDGRSWCECRHCVQLDAPAAAALGAGGESRQYPSTSGRMFTFANRVARQLARRDIDKPVYICAYADYLEPPPNLDKLEDNVVLFIARGIKWNRTQSAAQTFRAMFEQWQEKAARMALRGYPDNNSPMTVSPYPRLAFRWFRYLNEHVASFEGFSFSGDDSRDYALSGPTKYVIARLAWNPHADLEDILDEYYHAGWPGGHAQVRAYFDYFEERVNRLCGENDVRLCGWGGNGAALMSRIYDEASLTKASEWLDQAAAAALSPAERDRVDFLRIGLDMVRRETAYWAALLDLAAMGEPLVRLQPEQHETVPLPERHARIRAAEQAMLARQAFIEEHADSQATPAIVFHRAPERLTGMWDNVIRNLAKLELRGNPNRIILDDPWKFRIDPEDNGHAEKWFAPDLDTSTWADIRTNDFWERQGYGPDAFPENKTHGYNGWGWYRTAFRLPQHGAVEAVVLTLGAVDESYDLWVNGEKAVSFRYNAEKNAESWKEPQTVDITPFMRWNALNQITVAVLDTSGFGGIWQRCAVTVRTPNLLAKPVASWSLRQARFETRVVDDSEHEVLVVSRDTEFPVQMTAVVDNIEPGASYRFSLRLKPLECDYTRRTKYNKLLGVRIYGRDAGNAPLPAATYLNFGIPKPPTEVPGIWIPLSHTFQAPAGARQFVITVDVRQYGVYLFDMPVLSR